MLRIYLFAYFILITGLGCSPSKYERNTPAASFSSSYDTSVIVLKDDHSIAFYLTGINVKVGRIYQIPLDKVFRIYRINSDSTVTVW
jgi:hypothetical protein